MNHFLKIKNFAEQHTLLQELASSEALPTLIHERREAFVKRPVFLNFFQAYGHFSYLIIRHD